MSHVSQVARIDGQADQSHVTLIKEQNDEEDADLGIELN